MTEKSERPLPALREALSHVAPRRRRQLLPVLGLMLLGAVAELVSIGAILPFLAVVAEPERALAAAGPFAATLQGLGIDTPLRLVVAVALLFAFAALVAMAVRLSVIWVIQRYVFGFAKDLGVAVYDRTLRQPYAFHTGLNSSDTLAAVNKVQLVAIQLLMPLMQAASASVIALFILAALVAVDPVAAIASGLGFAAIYFAAIVTTRRIMQRNGRRIANAQSERLKTVSEGLGGIRDVLLDHSQPVFVARFERIETRLRRSQGIYIFIAQAPRLLVEGVGIALIAGVALALSFREGGLLAALPMLGALAFGAQRLLPLMQQVYGGWAAFAGNGRMLFDVLELLRLPNAPYCTTEARDTPRLPFTREIVLDAVGFSYPSANRPAVRDISLRIPKGARIGFSGKTGSGKSTLMDLVLGLLEPSAGRILIDGVELSDANRSAWQAQVAHVPQAIYLADASVTENIAFGVPAAEIDEEQVRRAAEQAELADVVAGLPQGYGTPVGERGMRLSGGQRQRIGIARALYRQASVLVIDEATSALDTETEAAVMRAIEGLSKDLTILIIAHRLSTLDGCDLVVRVDGGEVAAVETKSHHKTLRVGVS